MVVDELTGRFLLREHSCFKAGTAMLAARRSAEVERAVQQVAAPGDVMLRCKEAAVECLDCLVRGGGTCFLF